MEPTDRARWEPGHSCDVCGRPATMRRRDEEGWLCAPCYILTAVIRVKRIDDPATVRGLAAWLDRRSETRSHG